MTPQRVLHHQAERRDAAQLKDPLSLGFVGAGFRKFGHATPRKLGHVTLCTPVWTGGAEGRGATQGAGGGCSGGAG